MGISQLESITLKQLTNIGVGDYHWFDFQLNDGSKSVDYPMPMYYYYIIANRN